MGDWTHKVCRVCGRRLAPPNGPSPDLATAYCSQACQSRGLGAVDEAIEIAIEALLVERQGSICPSEAAKRVDPEQWRALMAACRMAARRLSHRGRVRILQRGNPLDPDDMRGPVRLARPR